MVFESPLETSDGWIKRSPLLHPLTGVHPFNAETPWNVLLESPITPSELHYVRNHGSVPRLQWATHKVSFQELGGKVTTFTMDQLKSFPQHSVVSTLVCSGNRRKELQLQRKTKGFSWGPAAVSTAEWTGTRVLDLLKACNTPFPGRAKFVCFNGPKGEVPLGDTSYGTAIDIGQCMNPAEDILLAYKCNGHPLTPDQGFPLRLIVPGYIGGRCIKWIHSIVVSESDSKNHYHVYDNRMLPSGMDLEEVDDEDWWHHPATRTTELNVNSVCLSPGPDECLAADSCPSLIVKGYAYAGGGRRVVRVEISLDNGLSWQQTHLTHAAPPNSYDKSYAAALWEYNIQYDSLVHSHGFRIRAWDEAMNTQPDRRIWNLMGIMNNSQYEIKIVKLKRQDGQLDAFQFVHPVSDALQRGGWMTEEQDPSEEKTPFDPEWEELEAERAAGKTWVNLEVFSWAEIHQHNKESSDTWFVRDGKIYDASGFIRQHPGGADSITPYKGKDATEEFNHIHSPEARLIAVRWLIGRLDEAHPPPLQAKVDQFHRHDLDDTHEAGLVALHPESLQAFALMEKEALSTDVRRFRFALPSAGHRLGVPVGHHVFIYAEVDGETIVRPYTPITLDLERGYFDLVIKIYFATDKKPGGKLSTHLDQLHLGEEVHFKGPCGLFSYLGRGVYKYIMHEYKVRRINMVAGGTGITPMLQIIKAIQNDECDHTQLSLIYANRSEADILLRGELQRRSKRYKTFRLLFCLSHPPKDWQGAKGHIDEKLMRNNLWSASSDTMTMLCGPPAMIKKACLPALKHLGHNDKTIIFL